MYLYSHELVDQDELDENFEPANNTAAQLSQQLPKIQVPVQMTSQTASKQVTAKI